MRLQSSISVQFWTTYFRSILFDLVVAAIFVWAFSPFNERAWWLIAALLVFWVIPILLIMKRGVFVILNYYLNKKIRLTAFLQDFRDNKYPQPDEYYADGMSFLLDVCSDDKCTMTAKRSAAINIGMIEAARMYSLFDMMLSKVTLDTAVEEWLELGRSKAQLERSDHKEDGDY